MKTNFKTKAGIKIQKVISKSFAAIISTVLVSMSLYAQDLDYSLLEKISFNETALAMVNTTAKTSIVSNNSNSLVAYTETETEEALQLEDWMMNESIFSRFSLLEKESESPMKLESWMTKASLFETNSAFMEVEKEEVLKLESWMTDESYFDNSTFQFIEETENALVIENWMLNEDLFSNKLTIDKPLELENWMISEQIWK